MRLLLRGLRSASVFCTNHTTYLQPGIPSLFIMVIYDSVDLLRTFICIYADKGNGEAGLGRKWCIIFACGEEKRFLIRVVLVKGVAH